MGSKNVPDRVPGCHCAGMRSLVGMAPGPPAGVGDAAGFEGLPPVITRVSELNPSGLEVLLEDENPPEPDEETPPDDIENAETYTAVMSRIDTTIPTV